MAENEGGVIRAVIGFFFGLIFTFLIWYAVPPVINIIPDTYSDMRVVAWLGLILLTILALVVVPAYQIIKGLRR